MKLNTPLLDPTGRPARLITQPIPGRQKQLAIVMYPDGRASVVDLAQCRVVEQHQDATKRNPNG